MGSSTLMSAIDTPSSTDVEQTPDGLPQGSRSQINFGEKQCVNL
jgi:hypothetical protein